MTQSKAASSCLISPGPADFIFRLLRVPRVPLWAALTTGYLMAEKIRL